MPTDFDDPDWLSEGRLAPRGRRVAAGVKAICIRPPLFVYHSIDS